MQQIHLHFWEETTVYGGTLLRCKILDYKNGNEITDSNRLIIDFRSGQGTIGQLMTKGRVDWISLSRVTSGIQKTDEIKPITTINLPMVYQQINS